MDEKEKIFVTKSSMPDYQEYCQEIKELWASHWLTNMGIKHKKLEIEIKNLTGAKNVTLFANGHLALEAIIATMQLKGEVITTPFTFASTTHAIVRNGLTPVFCDIKESNYTIDTNLVDSLINDNTSAILAVHVYGNLCDHESLMEICTKRNIKLIYDAAHAFGVVKNGENVATWGDASMFSFHATKVYNTIEGGAVFYKDNSLSSKLDSYKNFGIGNSGEILMAGTNAKMNEFQAAMGLCNLKNLEEEILKRKKIHIKYCEILKNQEGLFLNNIKEDIKSNYSYFPIVVDGIRFDRNIIYERLLEYNIFSRKYFYPLTSSFLCYKAKVKEYQTPIAKKIAANVLCLPMYADLSEEDVERVGTIILSTKK